MCVRDYIPDLGSKVPKKGFFARCSGRGFPDATHNMCSTRSWPDTSSVIGCSTSRRAEQSKEEKKKSGGNGVGMKKHVYAEVEGIMKGLETRRE